MNINKPTKADLVEKQLELTSKRLENKKKKLNIKEMENDMKNDFSRSVMDQISGLQRLMTDFVYDTDNTIFVSEPKFKNVLSNAEILIVKRKIFSLIEQL